MKSKQLQKKNKTECNNGVMENLAEYIAGAIGLSVGGILGFLCRSIIEHRLAIDRIKRNIEITDFNKASSRLRSKFAPTLSFIYIAEHHGNHDRPDIDKHIKERIFSHGSAVEEFRPFVCNSGRGNYQKAWEEYRKSVVIDQYDLSAEAKIEGISSERYLEKRIHNILQYAELK